ncbi:10803_t:CDS:2, partial [Gigaspora margarita]
KHYNKQTKSTMFTYWCICYQELEKKARKVLDNSKQYNTKSQLDCYNCKGAILVRLNLQNKLASVKLDHVYLHPRPQYIAITDEIKKYIKENLVYSASELYKQIVLEKINKIDDPVEVFSFITLFITELPKIAFETLLVDATYNMTKLKHKLYSILAVIDSTGFPISYLYISSGKNCDIYMILTEWFKAISNININNIKILLSDKDFSQISSVQAIWKDLRVQLCKWHIKRAIKQKLFSTKKGNNICYNANKAHPVIDPRWNNQHMDTILYNK